MTQCNHVTAKFVNCAYYVHTEKYVPYRKWDAIGDQHFNQRKHHQFSIASYNVLAQNLLHDNRDLYENSDPEHLTWEYRSTHLFIEIKHYKPDVSIRGSIKIRNLHLNMAMIDQHKYYMYKSLHGYLLG